MPIVPNKVSVYGDSTCIPQPANSSPKSMSRAQRIAQNPKFNGYNDYAYGGNSLAATLSGYLNGEWMFGQGVNFQQHISTADDSDIVVISLGGNDSPVGVNNQPLLSTTADVNLYQGSDILLIAQNALTVAQYAAAAGKRVVMCGVPYFDIIRASQPGGQAAGKLELAKAFAARLVGNNPAVRMAAAVANLNPNYSGRVKFVPTYGAPYTANQPPADYSSNYDGMHPTLIYSHAVSDFLAQWIVTNYSL